MNWNQLLCPERIRSITKSTTNRDLRTELEKDYHRIIGSAAFRRLQDKTQVFPLDKSDFIRTRLTHSLEVSSFAKSLGQNVGEKIISGNLDPNFGLRQKEDICAILQCAGLIHDIGNPPFGHFGETTIREWFSKNLPDLTFEGKPIIDLLEDEMKNDFFHFEGNAQAFRLVTKLHFLVDNHGMNLTKGLLATIIKYPVSSVCIDKNSRDIRTKKMGYFYADKDNFEDVEKSTGTNGRRHPLCFLLEAADDIAYITADIEDAFKKHYLPYDTLKRELDDYYTEAKPLMDDNSSQMYRDSLKKIDKKLADALAMKLNDPGEYAVQNWVIWVQGKAIDAVADVFIANYDEIMDGTFKKDLLSISAAGGIMKALGDIERRYVFKSQSIYRHEISEEVIMDFLLDKFVDAVVNFDTEYELTAVQERLVGIISENYMSTYKIYSKGKSKIEKLYLRLLLVTDYICGMTDTYAKSLYQELSGR